VKLSEPPACWGKADIEGNPAMEDLVAQASKAAKQLFNPLACIHSDSSTLA
jgi:hypothetical protein